MKEKDIDFNLIKSMSEEQQQQIYYTLSKRANQRIRDLQKKGYNSYASKKAKKVLQEDWNRKTFKQSKIMKGYELKKNLQALENFFTSETASAKGIKKLNNKRRQIFIDKGLHIKDWDTFFNFLSSKQFESLSMRVDSNQVVSDYDKANDEGFNTEQIQKQYDEFLNSDMTFEQVEERRMNGGALLK
jgi:hypothetical protein